MLPFFVFSALCGVTFSLNRKATWVSRLTLAGVFASSVVIGMTYSYAGALAVVLLSLALCLFMFRNNIHYLYPAVQFLGWLLGFYFSSYGAFNSGYNLRTGLPSDELVFAQSNFKKASAITRAQIYSENLKRWREAPVFGHGMGKLAPVEVNDADNNKRVFSFSHSVFLQILVQGGIVGFGLLLCAVAHLLIRAISLARTGVIEPLLFLTSFLPLATFHGGPMFGASASTLMATLLPASVTVWYFSNVKSVQSAKNRMIAGEGSS